MTIQINNIDELTEFIKRPDISKTDAMNIFHKTLGVIVVCVSEYENKESFVIDAENFINQYCRNSETERPLFLTSFGTLDD